ncbi:MAG: hypothetical protein LBP19_08145 [Treponema sp.]|jgi:hypothetical protein|nr:hypothetical protein [Treponema sp.]
MIYIAVIAYIVVVLSGVAGLVLDYLSIIKRTAPHAPLLSKIVTFLIPRAPILSRLFDLANIPLAVLTVSSCALALLLESNGMTVLILSGIFVIISCITGKIREHVFSPVVYDDSASPAWEYKADFAYIDTDHEIRKINATLLSAISETEERFQKQANGTTAALDYVNEAIKTYLALQKEECSHLLTEKKRCEAAFNALGVAAHTVKTSFEQFASKLDYSAAALRYCGESEALLKDIHLSFKDSFAQNRMVDEELMKNIDAILSNLHALTFKCAAIQSFPKAYTDAIGNYSVKMEAALKSFEDNNKTKQETIATMCGECARIVSGEYEEMRHILQAVAKYLHKNTFVLTKILETYKNAGLHKRELEALIQQYE